MNNKNEINDNILVSVCETNEEEILRYLRNHYTSAIIPQQVNIFTLYQFKKEQKDVNKRDFTAHSVIITNFAEKGKITFYVLYDSSKNKFVLKVIEGNHIISSLSKEDAQKFYAVVQTIEKLYLKNPERVMTEIVKEKGADIQAKTDDQNYKNLLSLLTEIDIIAVPKLLNSVDRMLSVQVSTMALKSIFKINIDNDYIIYHIGDRNDNLYHLAVETYKKLNETLQNINNIKEVQI